MKRIAYSGLCGLICLQVLLMDRPFAKAQFVGRSASMGRVGVTPFVYGGYRRGYGYGGYGYNPGSELQGLSSVIRAKSDAGLQYEETRSKYLDNRIKWQKTYYEQQSMYQAHIEDKDKKEAAIRDKWLENRTSGAPARLSASQLDPSTGKIVWPEALMTDDLATHRKKVEELYELRAHSSGSMQASKDIRFETDRMLAGLKAHIEDIPPNEYISARKFLDSLSYETQFAGR